MAFNLFKKSTGVPDVGREEQFDAEEDKKGKKVKEPEEEVSSKESVITEVPVLKDPEDEKLAKGVKGVSKPSKVTASNTLDNERNKLEFNKINAKIESTDAFIKGFNERFSNVSQQIGELRSMNLSNEKTISKAILAGSKAADIVKEVKPEDLMINYQKMDMRVKALSERLMTNKQFSETIMNEIKDLRKKAGIFLGTDALLKLNEEVKDDMVQLQKLSSRVRINTEKSEQLFIELKRGFADYQKVNEVIGNLDSSYSGLQEQVGKLKIDFSEVVKQKDFVDFKRNVDTKFLAFENSLSKIDTASSENERLVKLIEETLVIAKKNEEDIANIAISIGDDRVKKVSDYENQLTSILSILDGMAGQISNIKKKVGLTPMKISENINKKSVDKKLKVENVTEENQAKIDKLGGKPIEMPIQNIVEENKENPVEVPGEVVKKSKLGLLGDKIKNVIKRPSQNSEIVKNKEMVGDEMNKKIPVKKEIIKNEISKKIPMKKMIPTIKKIPIGDPGKKKIVDIKKDNKFGSIENKKLEVKPIIKRRSVLKIPERGIVEKHRELNGTKKQSAKVVMQRLENLKKAREVRMNNLDKTREKKDHIMQERLESLKKARKVHRRNIKIRENRLRNLEKARMAKKHKAKKSKS